MELAKTLKQMLTKKSLTVEKLAVASGVSPNTLKTWLQGKSPRDLDNVKKVATALGVSFEFLIFGEDNSAVSDLRENLLEEIFDGFVKVRIERIVPMRRCR